MRQGIHILLTAGIGLLVCTSATQSQDEQWLQYHSQREAQRIVGSMGMLAPRIRTDKPRGVELPWTERTNGASGTGCSLIRTGTATSMTKLL